MIASLTLPPEQSVNCARFSDLDGTLAEIKPFPDQVVIPETTLQHLHQLVARSADTLALILRCSVVELGMLTTPLRSPLAEVHRTECRDINGRAHIINLPGGIEYEAGALLHTVLVTLPGVTLRAKDMAFALHYRRAPEYEAALAILTEDITYRWSQLTLQHGKCVVETEPKGNNKDDAVTASI